MDTKLKIEVGKTYKTRVGDRARIYAIDGAGSFSVHGAIECLPEGWVAMQWSEKGGRVGPWSSIDDLIEEESSP